MSDTPKAPTNHLDEMTCLLYLERQLDRARGQEVSAHTQECEACRTLLRALERESRLLTRAMLEEEEPLPARLAEFQERVSRSMQWIWWLAFGLAATGAYALYTGYIEPWQQRLQEAGFGGTSLLGLLVFQGALWKGWQSMITLLEVIALLTLAGLGAAFLGRRIRRGSAVALVLTGMCTVLALPQAASASEYRKGASVIVAPEETIKGDIFIFAQRTRIEGTVDGDLYVFSHDVTISGHVTGDVIGFAQTMQVSGQVDGNVRAALNSLTISGSVNKNALAFADYVNVDSTGKIGGSVTAFAGNLDVDGRVGRDVLVYFHQGTISGTVAGGIRARGNSLRINSTAQVDGPVRFEGEMPADVSSGAKLASPVQYTKWEHKTAYRSHHYYVWQLIWVAAFVLYGLALFQLMPKFSREAIEGAEHYGASFGLGVLVLFALPIAGFIACVTVVGLFIGVSTLFLWYAGLYFAQIIVGGLVGQWVMGRTSELWPLIGRMTVGVVIVRLCTTIPSVGGWVKFGVILWGMGAIALALFRRFQPRATPGAPGAPVAPTPLPSNTTVGGVQAS